MAKYHNRKVIRDGMTFDSVKEYKRFRELLLLQQAGVVTGLERQVKYELIPSQRIGGKVVERACCYVADYRYIDSNGNLHVEDVKGYKNGGAYSVFVIKRKLMLHKYGIIVEEV